METGQVHITSIWILSVLALGSFRCDTRGNDVHDMFLQHLIIFIGRLSWRGVMGIAWRGLSVCGLAWNKSDLYNIWTAG
jgi:hypothetical protein